MQKLILVFPILSLLLIAGCSVESTENNNEEQSYSDCPLGNVDCKYPGACGKYIDTDNNDICDHSE